MSKWSADLEKINPDCLDVARKFEPVGSGPNTDQVDAFLAVVKDKVSGSEPFPDTPDRYLIGFSNICTHMGCRLLKANAKLCRYKPTDALICGPCPCHGTTFNLSNGGVVILGPASQHLPQLEISFSTDKKTVFGAYFAGFVGPVDEKWPIGVQS